MVQPPRPWPRPPQYDDTLSGLVAGGDLAQVRDYFDKVFWEGRKERPDWGHLKIALLREDRPMLRLLSTWGAAPSDDDMLKLKALAKEKYPDYLRVLRAAGLRSGGAPWEELDFAELEVPRDEIAKRAHMLFVDSGCIAGRDTDNWLKAEAQLKTERRAALEQTSDADEALLSDTTFKKDAAQMLEKVPQEWKRVVKAFRTTGADEAIIAGGALRDLFNERPIKDVDIFLRSQGSKKKNKKLLKEVFEASGLALKAQVISSDGYGRVKKDEFPEPRTDKDEMNGDGQGKRERLMESWKILAGPQATEYNVIFVDDSLDKKLAVQSTKMEQRPIFSGGLLDAFDVGLCQIACDGEQVVSTPAYRDDVKYKRISLLRPGFSTEDHLKRIVSKYAAWELNPEAQKALNPPKPPPSRRHSGYGGWY